MSTRTQGFVLLLFATALLRLGTSDVLLRFVKASARPWVLLAGAAVLLLALWSLVVSARPDEHPTDEHPTDEHPTDEHPTDEHGHGAVSRAAWLVVLPVVAVLVIGPPALGQFTANRRAPVTATSADTAFGPLPRADPVRLRMFDFALRAASDGGRTLAGRRVALTGFVARRATDGFVLARLVITCCAADASPVTVRVRTADPIPARGSWVRVTGRYAGQDAAATDVPLLMATAVGSVAAPAEPYD
ncbi:putative membrane protein [Jatrophihabitans endophyticus]|uniref:Putative membrane protein n=1 Tax=Jatrophihabitans endophyticus TaxID=1206085 RepID=A0A1M5D709_9ACTN|nr:TIGR03943 family protein [Jatrophihabitans endophyticus]SHF62829.1 putative membrane protein [Jatrophihabitans endophyticus]